jgi:hypothetical protein
VSFGRIAQNFGRVVAFVERITYYVQVGFMMLDELLVQDLAIGSCMRVFFSLIGINSLHFL